MCPRVGAAATLAAMTNQIGTFFTFLHSGRCGKPAFADRLNGGSEQGVPLMNRMLVERELTGEGPRRVGAGEAEAGTGAATGQARRTATVNLAESPLTWLHARGHLTDRQFEAGERLRADWERAQLGPSVTMRWDAVRVSGGDKGLTGSERQIAAKDRFDRALAAAGTGLTDILWRVVCAGEGLPQAERALAWPARSGKLVLSIALDRIAGFYRIR